MLSKKVFVCAAAMIVLSACVPERQLLRPNILVPECFRKVCPEQEEHSEKVEPLVKWREYFEDATLISLIEEALTRNQELHIFLAELAISRNEVSAKRGAYLPRVEIGLEGELDKVGEFTREGVIEKSHDIEPEKEFPEPFGNLQVGLLADWEVDVWGKLRNAEKSAVMRYLATKEGQRLLTTNLVAEVAESYFELLAFDNQLEILQQNIDVQKNALRIVKLQQAGARVTTLALRRFEAQLYKTKSYQYEIQQKIVETENKINFLLGRYPQSIPRKSAQFQKLLPDVIKAGDPTELLKNRPDIRAAELELAAADLDVEVARAHFYPSLNLTGALGYSAHNGAKLFESPESVLYRLGAGLTAPFLNRKEITALYLNASEKQIQAVVTYEQKILRAFHEVVNYLSQIKNLRDNYRLKEKRVKSLSEAVTISNTLFDSARADYVEVLLTQREALESKFELIETRAQQLQAAVMVYRALGGGWQREAEHFGE